MAFQTSLCMKLLFRVNSESVSRSLLLSAAPRFRSRRHTTKSNRGATRAKGGFASLRVERARWKDEARGAADENSRPDARAARDPNGRMRNQRAGTGGRARRG